MAWVKEVPVARAHFKFQVTSASGQCNLTVNFGNAAETVTDSHSHGEGHEAECDWACGLGRNVTRIQAHETLARSSSS